MNRHARRLRSGSLFSGVGGLDIAVDQVLGTHPMWFCDNDPAAARVLAYRYPAVPNLGDLTTVDWTATARVDVLTGGFPCQDLSAAGKQAGLMPGTRSGLWRHMATAIRLLRPRLVVIENVRNLLNVKAHHPAHSDLEPCPGCLGNQSDQPVLRALGAVLGDLADLGYDAVWCGLPASAVGAPHERFRVFILAYDAAAHPDSIRPVRDGSPWGGRSGSADHDLAAAEATGDGRLEGRPEPAREQRGPDAALRGGQAPADPPGTRRSPVLAGASVGGNRGTADGAGEVQPGGLHRAVADPHGTGLEGREPTPGHVVSARCAAADASRRRLRPIEPDVRTRQPDPPGSRVDWGIYTAAVQRWERTLGRSAPVPRVAGPRGGLKLNPALCGWMQGYPAGWFTDVPGVGINDALRLAGNSVNPTQAAAALRWCLAQLSAYADSKDAAA
jgi:DNA (cytosine-5)-methyltransferase 1